MTVPDSAAMMYCPGLETDVGFSSKLDSCRKKRLNFQSPNRVTWDDFI